MVQAAFSFEKLFNKRGLELCSPGFSCENKYRKVKRKLPFLLIRSNHSFWYVIWAPLGLQISRAKFHLFQRPIYRQVDELAALYFVLFTCLVPVFYYEDLVWEC